MLQGIEGRHKKKEKYSVKPWENYCIHHVTRHVYSNVAIQKLPG